jgi:hypothetical protein
MMTKTKMRFCFTVNFNPIRQFKNTTLMVLYYEKTALIFVPANINIIK